ncbi:MAG: sensor protein lytS [Candidatus Aminicenantes bacterium]|nr:sensor protein lytS [Candidatus Aminicenantes bacterium]NIM77821.1 sensor protein lytS [Candidatus Aminicenantes bacterium]NIN17133.1 sensor protein lytS [Candidatus Aminicenantes bacterium]NIN41026.1 sensor protein lytS [Candidatus Aminicenantes bacterium]NIN83831.1 sensor protein lytS [Candidatus Aminicenantes bacterium]
MKNKNTIVKKWWQQLWFRIILIFLGIGLVALLASMQMSGQACLFEKREIRYPHFLPINLLYFLCWGILFPVIQKLCHFISKRVNKWFLMVLLHIGLGILISLLHLLIFSVLIHVGIVINLVTLPGRYDLYTLAYRWMNSNIYIYIAIAGFLHFFYFYRQHREKALKTSQLETQMVQIQLQSLKSQLHPHFLFNALNTISAYVKKNPDIAIKMTARLSDLLRLTMDTKTHLEISLEEELKIVSNYLEIEKLRFADRLQVKTDIAPDTGDALVPAMLLQPLAENAVRHGISKKIDKGCITILSQRRNEKLELMVQDDGPGMKENAVEESMSRGIGLKNIRERLKRLYGDKSLMTIDSRENQGFMVKVTIPFRKSETI